MAIDLTPLYVGLDAGGSRTRLRAAAPGRPDLLTLEGPGANPRRIGEAEAARALATLLHTALDTLPGYRLATVVAGVAGIGRPSDRDRLHGALLPRIPPARLVLLSDAELALSAAHGPAGSGALVIAGTGSIVMARTITGDLVRAGGWGFLLGDEGGGYHIGLEGLKAVARALDGGDPTSLVDGIYSAFGMGTSEQLIQRAYAAEWAMADVAPLVLEGAARGDAVCQHIIRHQTTQLAGQVHLLFTRNQIEPSIRLTGGLIDHPIYARALQHAIQGAISSQEVHPLTTPPVEAAVQMAASLGKMNDLTE